jgi:sugar lactone lactonase YvrE
LHAAQNSPAARNFCANLCPNSRSSLGLGVNLTVPFIAALALSLFSICGLVAAPSLTQAEIEPQAVNTFQQFQHDLARDKTKEDWPGFLQDAKRQEVFLNGSPPSRLEVARAYQELGQHEQAVVETTRFLAMGQTNDILDTPLFDSLRRVLEKQIKANRLPVSLARPAFSLPDPGLLPEDIDYDPVSKRFFVTSILKQTVVALDDSAHQQHFAESPDHWPMMALKLDAKRRRLWVSEVAIDGFVHVSSSDWGRSALLEYDLDSRALLSRHEGPAHSNLGDMALASDGEPIVSDGDGGGIYRLSGQALRRIDHGEFISPQTIAICSGTQKVFVPDYVRGIAAFDIQTGAVKWLSTRGRYALDGVDGLYCHGTWLIAVQNGTSPQRVIVFTLNRSKSGITKETIIERATSTLGVPTHGVFADHRFFYIANSGWNSIDEHGVSIPTLPLTRATIMRFAITRLTAQHLGIGDATPQHHCARLRC